MNYNRLLCGVALVLVGFADYGRSETSVDDSDKHSWIANAGWTNWQGNIDDGVFFTEDYAGGFVWGANLGWISVGDGSPNTGTSYSNSTAGDFGVNVDSNSDPNSFLLSGYAWSSNAGWISFNVTGADRPRIERSTGTLKGYVYGANIGWLPLEAPGIAIVKTGLVEENSALGWEVYE